MLVLVLAGLGLYSILFLYHAIHQADAHTEIHYGESSWFFASLRVRYGLSLYFDYSHPPYIPMVYTPLAPIIAGLTAAALRASDEMIVPITRVLSIASTLAVSGAIFALCRRLGATGSIPALIAALLALTPSDTWGLWGHAARSDMLAIAIGLWSLFFVTGAPRLVGPIIGGALAGLAITAKQSEIAPVIAGSWWLLTQRRGLVIPFLGSALAGIALVLLPLGSEDLRLLLMNMRDLSSHPIQGDILIARFRDITVQFGPIVPLALVGLKGW